MSTDLIFLVLQWAFLAVGCLVAQRVESVCSAGDLGLIPGLRRSSGEGNGTILGASLLAQRVKSLPAMRETRVQSLGREEPLEKEMTTHSSVLA